VFPSRAWQGVDKWPSTQYVHGGAEWGEGTRPPGKPQPGASWPRWQPSPRLGCKRLHDGEAPAGRASLAARLARELARNTHQAKCQGNRKYKPRATVLAMERALGMRVQQGSRNTSSNERPARRKGITPRACLPSRRAEGADKRRPGTTEKGNRRHQRPGRPQRGCEATNANVKRGRQVHARHASCGA